MSATIAPDRSKAEHHTRCTSNRRRLHFVVLPLTTNLIIKAPRHRKTQIGIRVPSTAWLRQLAVRSAPQSKRAVLKLNAQPGLAADTKSIVKDRVITRRQTTSLKVRAVNIPRNVVVTNQRRYSISKVFLDVGVHRLKCVGVARPTVGLRVILKHQKPRNRRVDCCSRHHQVDAANFHTPSCLHIVGGGFIAVRRRIDELHLLRDTKGHGPVAIITGHGESRTVITSPALPGLILPR